MAEPVEATVRSPRPNNAAPVAEGGLKPTSVYTLDRVSRKRQVIAHLTEPIPEYWLADEAALEQFIRDELGYGLQLAAEDQVMNGDGEGVNLLGLLAVSGIQAQTLNISQILTVRSAITKVEVLGYSASGLALNPLDWEAIEIAADAEDRFFLTPGSNPVDRVARRLWDVPVALTTTVSQGAGTLLSDGMAGIVADRAVNLQWESSAKTSPATRSAPALRADSGSRSSTPPASSAPTWPTRPKRRG